MHLAESKTPETSATMAAQTIAVKTRKRAAKKANQKTKRASKAKSAAKSAAKRKPAAKASSRPLPKGAQILELIARPQGATLQDIMQATGWQAHSVRGFLSTARKKQNLPTASVKNEAGERVYSRPR